MDKVILTVSIGVQMQQNAYIADQPKGKEGTLSLYNDGTAVTKSECECFGYFNK